MNSATRYVMDIYQLDVIIRDTFEYVMNRTDYKVEVYEQRKNILKAGISENHPFDRFLKENGENGTKIRTNVQDFYDLVYGDESHAAFVENGKLIIDSGYALQVIDYVIGLHETIYDACRGFVEHGKKNGTAEPELENLLACENAYYRCIAGLVITDKIHNLFVEFNKAMRENKGVASPQSNFISNDLRKAISFFKFTEEHANLDDDIYKLAVEKTKRVVDLMGGKEKLDETGEGLRNEIIKLHELWLKNIALTEGPWRVAYSKEIQGIMDFDKARKEAAAKPENGNAEEAKPAEEKETPVDPEKAN